MVMRNAAQVIDASYLVEELNGHWLLGVQMGVQDDW